MTEECLADKIKKLDARSIAKTITLLESSIRDERQRGLQILSKLKRNNPRQSQRICISGPPGAGKSSLINSLGGSYLDDKKKVAVLAIDPSSQLTQGSLLGDRTRMSRLNMSDNCFIRPSPTKGELGGVAPYTFDAVELCEAAGFDIIIVETVGVGQSETAARNLVDCYVVLQVAGGGDDVQGIKRGILELADIVAINKADGDSLLGARSLQQLLINSLHIARGESAPAVICTSATLKNGVDDLINAINNFFNSQAGTRKDEQRLFWLQQALWFSLKRELADNKSWAECKNEALKSLESVDLNLSEQAQIAVTNWLKSRD